MTKIIAFGGEKQSGKNTCCSFVVGYTLFCYNKISKFYINDDTTLNIITANLEYSKDGKDIGFKNVLPNLIDPKLIKVYAFADSLKETISNIFNIPLHLLYGTDKAKDTLTKIRWSNFPGCITNRYHYDSLTKWTERRKSSVPPHRFFNHNFFYHEDGFMTIRELLQFFGTDICRKMYNDCWVNSTFSRIEKENPEYAVICDMRFDNEHMVSVDKKATVVHLLKRNKNKTLHISENGLSNNLKWDCELDNRDGDLLKLQKELITFIKRINFISYD